LEDQLYSTQVRAEIERLTTNLDAEAERIHTLVLSRVKGT
jgi:hypothetical protein